MSEMVERVARAIAREYNINPDELACGQIPQFLSHPRLGVHGAHLKMSDEYYMPVWKLFLPQAKAAIEAMREPTAAIEQMSMCNDFARNLWPAMIDEALK